MSTRDATTALRRFGLGARPGEIKRIAADPRGFVLQALSRVDVALINDPQLEPSYVTFASARAAQQRKKLIERTEFKRSGEDSTKTLMAPDARETAAPPPMQAEIAGEKGLAKAATPPLEKPGQIRREAF
jgi:uncharacterized protein (DUF1800 family)